MATTENYINYVCEKLNGLGEVRYRKMFGEYMVYIDDKPIIIVCENTAFVKKLECIEEDMKNHEVGCPYEGAKEHYVLDLENEIQSHKVLRKLIEVTPIPKKKKAVKKSEINTLLN